jgi:serine/threonine protein phosphatase PrpC
MRPGRTAAVTDPGRKRRHNEDAYVCEPPLFAVADGMGGAQAGEIASRLAAAALRRPRDAEPGRGSEHVVALVQEANRRVYEAAAGDEAVSGMGTTITAAVAEQGCVWIGHVGDSRAYLVRDGALDQLTEDHSLVAELVRSGKLSPEEAETHPQRSVITRAIGTDPDVDVDVFAVQTRPGDLFMLCSDGLTSMVADGEILEILERDRGDLQRAGRALVDAANREGGEDNITVVLFEILEEPQAEGGAAGTDEPTLTELDRVPTLEHAVPSPDGWRPATTRRRRVSRPLAVLVALAVLALAAGLAVWGLSSAYFVGATSNGHVAVYQGVPWDLVGRVKLYRLRYESRMLAAQLSRAERRRLFDHSLMSYGSALREVRSYEQDAVPR